MNSKSDLTQTDAWFLLSISYVSPNGELAELPAIIGAADFINHAILTHREIESSAHKLTRDGWINYCDGQFSSTKQMIHQFTELPQKPPIEQMKTVETWLNTSKHNSDDNANAETKFPFPDITEEMVNLATTKYTNR